MKKIRTKPRNQVGQFNFQNLEPRKLMASLTGGDFFPLDQVPSASHIQTADPIVEYDSGPAQRIVNGEQTDGWEAVGFVGPLGCTGTLISPTHVLTAAHCLEGVSNTGAFFEVNGQTYNSSQVTIHENYNPNQFDAGYDLAIIELDRPVTGVQPMQINRTTPQVGSMLTLVGFGEGGTSQGGFDPNDSGKQVGRTELEEVTQQHISWNFDSHNEANTAPGDSGGPAFIEVNGQFLIAGVTSGGSGDAHTLGDYSFDTRVDVHAAWIDALVGKGDGPDEPGGDDHTDEPGTDATQIQLTNGTGIGYGDLETTGDRDAFQFTLVEDGETTISLKEDGSDVDTYLRIYDSQGKLIHENDDSGGDLNSEIKASLSAGTYFATAGSYNDSETGKYDIRVNHEVTNSEGNYDSFTNNTPLEISEFGRDRVVSTLNVSGLTGNIADLNIKVNIQHTYDADLRLVLVAPDRTRIVLVNQQGGSGDNFAETEFDQQASQHINNADAPFSGTYRPAQNLDQLNGIDPNGRWRLVVIDFEDMDGGSLDSWTLEIETDSSRKRKMHSMDLGRPTNETRPNDGQESEDVRRRRFHHQHRPDNTLATNVEVVTNVGEATSDEVPSTSERNVRPGIESIPPTRRAHAFDEVFASSEFDGIFS